MPEQVLMGPSTVKQEVAEIAKTITPAQTVLPRSETYVKGSSPLEAVLIGEIRTSLRGRTAEELSHLVDAEIAAVTDSLVTLVRRGTLSQRGPRFFVG
jgi:hypothetical protein